LRSSSICQNIKVVFHFSKILRLFCILKNWGRLPIEKNWDCLKYWGCFSFLKIEVVFHLPKY
jgi:hypothetical protein